MEATRLAVLVLLCLSTVPCCLGQVLETYPVQNQGEDKIVVEVSALDDSVSLYCSVEGGSTVTNWTVGGDPVEFDIATGVGMMPYEYLIVAGNLSTNLTVVVFNFTEPTEVECRYDEEVKVFLIGIRAGPILNSTKDVRYDVTEGNSFFLDLKDGDPFPPYNNPVTSSWLLNGSAINDSRIMVGDYNISISSVWRSLTGMEFSLNVSTSDGYDMKTFSLNVQYPPEADIVYNDVLEYGEVDGSVHLIAVEGLRGNPTSITYDWLYPNGSIIMLTGMDRFTFLSSDMGNVLIIDPIMETDFGDYTFTATNGIGSDLVVIRRLVKAVPPGKPSNVTASSIKDESAIISWLPPTNGGSPPLTKYSIQLYPPTDDGSVFETMDNSTMFTLSSDLIPGTTYNLTVAAVSDFEFQFSTVETSGITVFNTSLGVPRISPQTRITIVDGMITLLYSLKHTGGYDLNTITIEATCGPVDTVQLPTESKVYAGSGDIDSNVEGPLSGECMMNCLNNQLSGELKVGSGSGPLTAGVSYVCAVVAGNEEGEFYYNTTTVIAETGIPAPPVVTVTPDAGGIIVTVESDYPGVPMGDTSFYFHVVVFDDERNIVYNMNLTGTGDQRITIGDLPLGNYTVEVKGINTYGESMVVVVSASVTMESFESPTPTDKESFPFYAIVAVAVGGTLLIFCIFITIMIIGLCVNYKRKKDSVSFYQSRYEMTIKRY